MTTKVNQSHNPSHFFHAANRLVGYTACPLAISYFATKIITSLNPIVGVIYTIGFYSLFFLAIGINNLINRSIKKNISSNFEFVYTLLPSTLSTFYIAKKIINISALDGLKLTVISGIALPATFIGLILIGVGISNFIPDKYNFFGDFTLIDDENFE